MEPKVLVIADQPDLPQMWTQLLVLGGVEISIQDHIISSDDDTAVVPGCYDLILLNLQKKPSESVETCRKLRSKYAKPILVMLHDKDEDLLLRVYEAGADDCLVQPMSNQLLLAVVKAWLRRAQICP